MRSGEMAGIHYLSRKEQHPDNQLPMELTNDSSFSYDLARRLPHLLKERTLNLGKIDKIFASQWLTENDVVVGTKCNKLIVLDTTTGRKVEIPKLQNAKTPSHKNPCGIHCVCVSQDHRFLATGGNNPNDLAVYSLPTMDPVMVGETLIGKYLKTVMSHTDWIFNIQWITDSLLITGSRDSTMALWSISEDSFNRRCIIAEDVPVMKPIFRFPNILRDQNHTAGERVRSLAYNRHGYILGSLQTNPCEATLHFWDVYSFKQVSKVKMPYCAENVCIELDNESTHLYAIGSRSHISFVDDRLSDKVTSVRSLDKDCSVRSLQFNRHLLSTGTGAGHLYFYDLCAQKYLDHDFNCLCGRSFTKADAHSLTASPGWLRRDQTYRDFFSGVPDPPNAIYTHCYSPMKTKIFTAGGPLPLGLCGNYAAVWI